MSDLSDYIEGMMNRINRSHDQMDDEFRKLLIEPSSFSPKVGDRVVVAGGLIGRGYLWVRLPATVVEVGETSVFVEFDGRDHGGVKDAAWLHPALITDVLPPKE